MVEPTGGRTAQEQEEREAAIAAGKAQRARAVEREARITAKATALEAVPKIEPSPDIVKQTPDMAFDQETGKTYNVTEPAKPVEVNANTGIPLDTNEPRYNEIIVQVANQAAKQAVPIPVTSSVREFANTYGMSEKAAAKTITGIVASGGHATEFRNLSPAELADAKAAFTKAATEKPEVVTTKPKTTKDTKDSFRESQLGKRLIVETEPQAPKPVVANTPVMVLNSNEYRERVLEEMIKRPRLTQIDAERIVAVTMRHEGKDVKEPSFTQKLAITKDQFAKMTPSEKAEWKKAVKHIPMQLGELVVPGVSTGTHWTVMSTKEKIISIGWDVVAVGLILFGGKIIGTLGRSLSGVNKVKKVATIAGKEGKKLTEVTKLYESAIAPKTVTIKPGTTGQVKLANAVETARVKSVKADNRFINQLLEVKSISPGELAKLEKLSGIKNIKTSFKHVSKTTDDLAKAWKKVDKTSKTFKLEPKTPHDIIINKQHLLALRVLQRKQIALQEALARVDSVLKPRYTSAPPPDEFKGFQMKWETKAGEKPIIKAGDDDVFKQIEGYLARTDEIAKGKAAPKPWELAKEKRVAIATKEKVQIARDINKGTEKLKLKAKFEKPKVSAKEKIKKVPKVERKPSVFPGIRIKSKEAAAARQAIASQGEEFIEARAKTIEDHLRSLRSFENVREWSNIREAIQTSLMNLTQTNLTNKSAAQIRELTETELKSSLQPRSLSAPQIKALTATVVKNIPKILIPPSVRLELGKPGKPVKPIIVPPPRKTDKEKRDRIKASEGAIAWRQGELGGKDVWHTIMYPYASEADYLTVLGAKPSNTTIVKGVGSAYQTVKLRYGIAPAKTLTGDIGFFDFAIEPKGRHNVGISFTPDPKLETRGTITIGISKRMPPLTDRGRFSSRRMPRVTPKRPKLR